MDEINQSTLQQFINDSTQMQDEIVTKAVLQKELNAANNVEMKARNDAMIKQLNVVQESASVLKEDVMFLYIIFSQNRG